MISRIAALLLVATPALAQSWAPMGPTGGDVRALAAALQEAVENAVWHGHGGDPGREVRVRYRVTAEHVLVEVEDQGPGFDPAAVPDPRADENLEKLTGRGLLLMRHHLSWLCYNERGNAVTLCKRRTAA